MLHRLSDENAEVAHYRSAHRAVAYRGAITVQLDVSTTGADTNFAVRLIDVDTTGVDLLIGESFQRLKLRDTLSTPSEVLPGVRYSVEVKLTNALAYTFATGHSVGIIVTSSNYDRFDKNPTTGTTSVLAHRRLFP